MQLSRDHWLVRWAFSTGEPVPHQTTLCGLFWRAVLYVPILWFILIVFTPIWGPILAWEKWGERPFRAWQNSRYIRKWEPPGRCVVLRCERALWVTSWPYAQYVRHRWPGAWINSLFRNEGAGLSSELILEAVAASRWYWPDVPALGLVTFVDAKKTRRKRDPGRCYRRAGFEFVGFTEGGLYAFQLLPERMPAPEMPLGVTRELPLN